jgi:RNA polymerase sigma-70 factor, ECF subfamily
MLRGDERAIAKFMDEYFPRLYRFALVRLDHHAADAEDVVQQTLIIAARRIETYRGEAALMTWVTRICRHELGRYRMRDQARDRVVSLFDDEDQVNAIINALADDVDAAPAACAERGELISLIHMVLDQLPHRHGDVLEWKYIEGLSIREIADRMELSGEAVQSQLARARKSFRQAFAGFYQLYQETP